MAGYGRQHLHFGHHREPQEGSNPEPVGELVSVYSESNGNYRLAVKPEGVVLTFKNRRDPEQQWIKMDMGDKFVDSEGNPGFVLINKKTGLALKHSAQEGEPVTAEIWRPHSVDHTMLWSQSNDVGKGYTTIRMVTNVALNLDADHGDRRHGGVKEGHRLILYSWNKGENQKWKLEPVELESEPSTYNA
ncbi:hypothetical protein R1sor_014583 [Riccia sorocarpa]|uniref:Ricin B lectin domain-containing protein n=1 Tax=Riccia sorocarpa TaxID=122646 RepID=A0ABD3HCN0_9MARC